MVSIIKKAWDSPTITTWASYSTKAISLFLVLPLILRKFPANDIVLWYLFFTVISLQSIADFGFRQTFSRLIAYAFGGAADIDVFNSTKKELNAYAEPNLVLMRQIVSNMKHIYFWLTMLLALLMATLGTWSMLKPVNQSSTPYESWISWIIVLLVTCINFYGKIYMNYLEGLYKIAVVRRVEVLTSLGVILSSALVMLFAPTILNMVIVNQAWLLVATYRDWYLCRTVNNGLYKAVSPKLPFDKNMFFKIWQPAWRSGISGLMSVGLTSLSGVAYAQIGSSAEVAGFLLTLRLITQIKEIAMAPFYSKIPLMSMLRVKHDTPGLIKLVKKSMFMSHITFAIGAIVTGLAINQVLRIIHSEVTYIDPVLWLTMSVAFFMHRYGAMHIQVYISTNHVISHIADGVSGVLYILASILLSKYAGVYAIPLGMMVGYVGFYAWYSAKYSLKSMDVKFFDFERNASLVPVTLLVGYAVFVLIK